MNHTEANNLTSRAIASPDQSFVVRQSPMIVMPANSSHAHTLSMVFPKRLGMIMCPSGKRTPRELPWACDNELYAAWAKSGFASTKDAIYHHWDSAAFLDMLVWCCEQFNKPRWVVVPDVPGNARDTLREFAKWAPHIESTGLTLAMAVQDGMNPSDVPDKVVCFVGGSTEWKWANVRRFCDECERTHVGRVNRYEKLWICDDAGAESVDGSGFFRGDQTQQRGLMQYLKESAGYETRTRQLGLALS